MVVHHILPSMVESMEPDDIGCQVEAPNGTAPEWRP